MRQSEIVPQVDRGTRYLWLTPRGTVAVDEDARGSLAVVFTLEYRGTHEQRRRDARQALRATQQAITESEEASS